MAIELNPRKNIGVMLIWSDENLWILEIFYFLYQSYCFLHSSSRSTTSREDNVFLRVCIEGFQQTTFCIMHHLGGIFSEMAELCMRIGYESLSIADHGLDWGIGSISSCMIDINGLQFYFVRTCKLRSQSDDVFTYKVDFVFLFVFLFL